MSIRSEIRPYLVLTNDPMTKTVSSSATIVQKISMVSYQFVWSAGSSPVGTAGVQVSNNYALNPDSSVKNAGTWSTYWFQKSDGTFVTSLAISGSSGDVYLDLFNLSSYAVRALYTFSSGSGTLNITVNGKVS